MWHWTRALSSPRRRGSGIACWVCHLLSRYQAQKWSFLSEHWTWKSLSNFHFHLFSLPVLAQGNAGSCCSLSPSHFRNIFCSLFNGLKPPRQNGFSKHWYCSRRGHRCLDHCWVFYAAVVQSQPQHVCVLCYYFNLEAAHTLNSFWSRHWSWTHIYM